MTNQNGGHSASRKSWRSIAVLLAFALIATIYLAVMEHRAHLSGLLYYLPYLLLLACPLMHVFHHGRHRGHGAHTQHAPQGTEQKRIHENSP